MKNNLNLNQRINNWTVVEGPIIINGKNHYKLQCSCGKVKTFDIRYIMSKHFSISCRSCSQIARRNSRGRVYDIGTKIQNLTILSKPYTYKNNLVYRVKCDCGHIFKTGHSTLYRKRNGMCLPYCNSCFSQDKKSPKRNTMLTEHISKSRYGHLVHTANDRGIEFSLSPEYLEELWIKQEGCCALSKLPISLFISSKDSKFHTASLDRINSNIGYIEGNVQWVHKDINYMKCDFTQEEFINYCVLISKVHANQQLSQE